MTKPAVPKERPIRRDEPLIPKKVPAPREPVRTPQYPNPREPVKVGLLGYETSVDLYSRRKERTLYLL